MKVLSIATSAKKLKSDPLGFIIDSLIAIVVNLIIPIPLAGNIVAQFKAPILGLLASLVILALFMITVIGTIVVLPIAASSGFLQTIAAIIAPGNQLNIAPDTSFTSTSVPKQNPFGGSGMTYTNISANFMDPDYYLKFGRNHTGVDLVPSDAYYQNSKTYKDTQKVVIFATINGNVSHYVDQYGGETVEITNNDNSIKVLYVHFSTVLAESGAIAPGMPVGIMGDTGFATGEHVHYEVRINDNGSWLPVNPLNYIQ